MIRPVSSRPADPMRRYVIRTAAFMGAYVIGMIALMGGAFDDVESPGAWLLALAVSAPILGQIWATLSLIREADEYVAAVVTRQFILGAGLAMGVATVWGFGETFAGAPHAPAWLIYPLFWAMVGLASPFIRRSGR